MTMRLCHGRHATLNRVEREITPPYLMIATAKSDKFHWETAEIRLGTERFSL